jgi:glycosyltransferase involved in cell wall biosynthesis
MNINLSIVMATNNLINLNSFLKNLYLEMPSNFEIIVVFPISKKNLLSDVKKDYLNLKFIFSSIENQVIQRIMGFKEARGDFILQIDDDIKLNIKELLELKKEIENKQNVCIAPSLVGTSKQSTWMNAPKYFNSKFYYLISYINNGKLLYESGKFSKAGLNMSFDININNSYEVEWLPGGCILHHRNNIILKNFYPFIKGKSFAEDLYHSKHLSASGIKLFYAPHIKLNFFTTRTLSFFSSILNIMSNIKVMNKFVYNYGGNILRLNLVLFLYYIWLLFFKLKTK